MRVRVEGSTRGRSEPDWPSTTPEGGRARHGIYGILHGVFSISGSGDQLETRHLVTYMILVFENSA